MVLDFSLVLPTKGGTEIELMSTAEVLSVLEAQLASPNFSNLVIHCQWPKTLKWNNDGSEITIMAWPKNQINAYLRIQLCFIWRGGPFVTVCLQFCRSSTRSTQKVVPCPYKFCVLPIRTSWLETSAGDVNQWVSKIAQGATIRFYSFLIN